MMLNGKHVKDQTIKPSKFNTAGYTPVQLQELTTVDFVLKQALTVEQSSLPYIEIVNKQLKVKALAVSSVTTDTTALDIQEFVDENYTGSEFQQGDTIVLANAEDGSEAYIHNGGTTGTVSDFTVLQNPVTETDPTVPAWVKGITQTQINQWGLSYTWGNHALAGYLKSLPAHTHTVSELTGGALGQIVRKGGGAGAEWWTPNFLTAEADPTVPAWVKNITNTQISQWSTSFSWGDHQLMGYLTALPTHKHPVTDLTGGANGQIIRKNPTNGTVEWFTPTYLSALPAHTHPVTDLTGGANGQIIRKNPTNGTVEWFTPTYLTGLPSHQHPVTDLTGGANGDVIFFNGTPVWAKFVDLWASVWGEVSGGQWETNGTSVWRSGGNVGIGQASPTYPLQILKDAALLAHLINTNANGSGISVQVNVGEILSPAAGLRVRGKYQEAVWDWLEVRHDGRTKYEALHHPTITAGQTSDLYAWYARNLVGGTPNKMMALVAYGPTLGIEKLEVYVETNFSSPVRIDSALRVAGGNLTVDKAVVLGYVPATSGGTTYLYTNGSLRFDTATKKVQVYVDGNWLNLH